MSLIAIAIALYCKIKDNFLYLKYGTALTFVAVLLGLLDIFIHSKSSI